MNKFHYLLLNKFALINKNSIEEILRERAHYFAKKNRVTDFWVIEYPNFACSKNKLLNEENQSYIIISSDKAFINWLALRVGLVSSFLNKKHET